MKNESESKIDKEAMVINSSIEEVGVSIWRGAHVKNTILKKFSSVGNDSIVVDSSLDAKCEIGRRNIISHASIGKGSSTQSNTTIRYSSVGKYCAIAWNVTIGAPNHEMHRLAIANLEHIFNMDRRENMVCFEETDCTIGNDVWIAAGSHIMRGVSVSDGAVVAANAVVTKDVPPYAIVAGVPAKIIGYRFSKEQIERLLKIQWWDFSEETLEGCKELFMQELTNEVLWKLEQLKK